MKGTRRIKWGDMGVSSCFEILKHKGYSLKGYSGDTIIELMNEKTDKSVEECEKLFLTLTTIYG